MITDSPTSRQKSLPVHFGSTFPAKLFTRQVGVVGGVDVVVVHGVVHFLVDFQVFQEYGSVLVRHEVMKQTSFTNLLWVES